MIEPSFKVIEEKSAPDFGQFIIEPLEPGFGHTLGNALRRILLISIPGVSITSIKISGAKHKFSTIAGMKENVIDLLLNLKGLNLKLLNSKNSSTIRLKASGQKEIKASDLELSEDVEVVNKDHYIASLTDKKAKIDMELTVERGTGYSLAEERRSTSIGLIPTDAIFTPVRRVNYEVTATRVGRQTNLDKLILQVWTNGVVSPRQALDEASRILSSYFLQVYEPKEGEATNAESAKPAISDAISKMTIDELDLPTRIYNSLRNGGVETVGQLLETPRKDLISMRNMGGKSISIIEAKLKEKDIEIPA